jgi:hypothetical protein
MCLNIPNYTFSPKGEPRSERKRWRYYGQWDKNRQHKVQRS